MNIPFADFPPDIWQICQIFPPDIPHQSYLFEGHKSEPDKVCNDFMKIIWKSVKLEKDSRNS